MISAESEAKRSGLVPVRDQRIAALLRRPVVLGEDGDAVRHRGGKRHDLLDALHLLRGRGVEALQLRAEARRMQDDRRQHAGQLHVLREDRGAVRLRGRVRARGGLADEDEVLRVLQLHVSRHGLLRRVGGELAESRLLGLPRKRFRGQPGSPTPAAAISRPPRRPAWRVPWRPPCEAARRNWRSRSCRPCPASRPRDRLLYRFASAGAPSARICDQSASSSSATSVGRPV